MKFISFIKLLFKRVLQSFSPAKKNPQKTIKAGQEPEVYSDEKLVKPQKSVDISTILGPSFISANEDDIESPAVSIQTSGQTKNRVVDIEDTALQEAELEDPLDEVDLPLSSENSNIDNVSEGFTEEHDTDFIEIVFPKAKEDVDEISSDEYPDSSSDDITPLINVESGEKPLSVEPITHNCLFEGSESHQNLIRTRTKLSNPFLRLPLPLEGTKEEEELAEEFINQLESEQFEVIFNLKIRDLDYRFTIALRYYDFIGELPISQSTFEKLAEYLKEKSEKNGYSNPKRTLPTIYTVVMVFFARYSETDVGAFWQPYAEKVWKCNASQSFQNTGRELFAYSRAYLHETIGLSFNAKKQGDVVRPIYQHAIIPFYLQGNFADWLIHNFENIMQYPPEQLRVVLKREKSLDYVPIRLRKFVQGEETIDTASRLVARMTDAIQLFYEDENTHAVESVLSSSIERSLWKLIFQRLSDNKSRKQIFRKVTPKLTWKWNLDVDDLYLSLSKVHSDKNEKPDTLVWAKKDEDYFMTSYLEEIFPWEVLSGDWETEPWTSQVIERQLLDGSILLLSENFELDKPKNEQEDSIIFDRAVPDLPKELMCFRVDSSMDSAEVKDQISSNGSWIIVSNDAIQISDKTGEVELQQRALPQILRESGFTQAVFCDIQLPCAISVNHNLIASYEDSPGQFQIEHAISGEEKCTHLAKHIPPVFSTSKIDLEFSLNRASSIFKKSLLSIRHNGDFLYSFYLSDLQRRGHLEVGDNCCRIDLSSYLKKPGTYILSLVHDLKSLLDNPIQFSWLPKDVYIKEPPQHESFSPDNPATIEVSGVSVDMIKPYVDEKCKMTENDNTVTLQWHRLKGTKCRFDLLYENYPIHFCWEVDRVAAWIDGGGVMGTVPEGEDENIELNIRGKSGEPYSWQVEGCAGERQEWLNKKGEFKSKLSQTVLRDMLRESTLAQSSVSINIRNYTWVVFKYSKNLKIEITNVKYAKQTLEFSLSQERKLGGSYSIAIRNIESPVIIHELSSEFLENKYEISIELTPGEYLLEILLNDSHIHSSEFEVEDDGTAANMIEMERLSIVNRGSPEMVFRGLTALKPEFLLKLDNKSKIHPLVKQLKFIHKKEEWLNNEEYNEGFLHLLPSWAVLAYPLRFITKIRQRSLHIFPEKVLYGGRAGLGYTELKVDDEKLKLAASWRSDVNDGWSRLWLGVPEELEEVDFYSEIDQNDLWPGYQCRDCSTIVASRNGTRVKLPPSVVKAHQHGKNRTVEEQFIDTVFGKNAEVIIEQFKFIFLEHAHKVSDAAPAGYLRSLLRGTAKPISLNAEFSLPINLFSSDDYCIAISELYDRLDNLDKQFIKKHSNDLFELQKYINSKDIISAFGPAHRLFEEIVEYQYPFSIPGLVFAVAMALRLKAYDPAKYTEMIQELTISETSLKDVCQYFAEKTPKLFVWSTTVAEIFYVHAAS